MNIFSLSISSYSKIIYVGQATYCGLFTKSGAMGIEANHEPMLGVIKPNSEITYKNDSGIFQSINVKSGLFSFENNECTITVE